MYRYETHCHTAISSACASMSEEDVVKLFTANGYTGVFITDHFLNGNTTVNARMPNATYEEKIEEFVKSYRAVKKAAEGKLDVFFGFEVSYLGTDFLLYGYDEESLKKVPEIVEMDFTSLARFCKEQDILAVHAHPFREANYIDHIRLYPGIEGVEVLNAARDERTNRLAKVYADEYEKVVQTGGSDVHHVNQKMLSGMEFEEKITSVRHFINLLRAGKGRVFTIENAYRP